MLISYLRHIPVAVDSMRGGEWRRSKLGGTELRGRTMLIVGLGRIGSEVARRGRSFGLRLIGYDPYVSSTRFDELGVEQIDDFHEALALADVITLHVPLTSETHGMIGKAELARLRPTAMLLNFARGGIIDEDALLEALQEDR